MRWTRPPEPDDFERSVADARATVAAIAATRPPRSDDFDRKHWSRRKGVLASAQHHRCAYCDLPMGFGDVEHYHPKAGVDELPEWSSPEPPRAAARAVSPTAWWWLAYRWSNFLAACEVCNRRWKGNLFPMMGGHAAAPAESEDCRPLLLNPFEGPDPEAHLTFDRLGGVRPQRGSPHGLATLRTCGLYRHELVEHRHASAEAAHRHLDELDHPAVEVRRRALRELGRAGSARTPLASVARCIWRDRTEVPWHGCFRTGNDGFDRPTEWLSDLVVRAS